MHASDKLQTVLFVCVATALASVLGVRESSPASPETIEKLSSSLFRSLSKQQDDTMLSKDEFIDISALALESLVSADLRTLYEVVFVQGDFEFGRSDNGQLNLVASPTRGRQLIVSVKEKLPVDEEKELLLVDLEEDDGVHDLRATQKSRSVPAAGDAEDTMEGFLEVYSIAIFEVKMNGGEYV